MTRRNSDTETRHSERHGSGHSHKHSSHRSHSTSRHSESSGATVEEQKLNDELHSVISDYWKDNQAPGFTGYQQKKDAEEEEIRFQENDSNRPARHTQSERPSDGKNRKKHRNKKEGSKLVKALKIIFLVLILLIAGAIASFAYMQYKGEKASKEEITDEEIKTVDDAVSENGGKTVTYKGVRYTYNENISTILFIGVDREEYNEEEVNGTSGQSDTVIVITINHETGETKMIPISRNTMVQVDEYNTDGSYWRQSQVQLALAFAYGDGKAGSCENVSKAVSRVLYGMPINRYVAFDLSCIAELNDAVGGVEVTIPEDMTEVRSEWEEGATVTLHGEEAEIFVRNRRKVVSSDDEDNNAARMERQKIFMSAFVNKVIAQMKDDVTLPLNLYKEMGDDVLTDITNSEIVYYASLIARKGFNNTILSIDGEVSRGEYTEFYPDKEQLYQLVLDTFYVRE